MLSSTCMEAYMFWATIIFWIGSVAIGIMIARRYKLGVKDTIFVMVGLKTVPWAGLLTMAIAVLFAGVFGLLFWGMDVCKGLP